MKTFFTALLLYGPLGMWRRMRRGAQLVQALRCREGRSPTDDEMRTIAAQVEREMPTRRSHIR